MNIPLENVNSMESLAEVREVLMPFVWLEQTGVADQDTIQAS